jgi:2-keto-4-pentenoate hydratase/2-oxohepta-3-ene-1,7-dioic acid hydratase in catechol pathway
MGRRTVRCWVVVGRRGSFPDGCRRRRDRGHLDSHPGGSALSQFAAGLPAHAQNPSKIVCVGRNYRAHAAEFGSEVPTEPLIFLKPPSALIALGEEIVLPDGVGRVDFEGEIALVIGRHTRFIGAEDAWSHVAGLAPLNDVTARDLQRSDKQWTRAKGFDTFCPLGTVVPTDEVDWDTAAIETRVNGEVRQSAPASDMVFDVPFLIAYISRIMTLNPGDVIATGTPDGVGPLHPGDEVVVSVHGVGELLNPVVGESP